MSGAPRHDLIPILSLAGVILDALGGLYLAYDLLGGKRGPLRTGGGAAASPQTLYFTTGLVAESDGLFGTLTPIK
jgi:hypothetical protein